jgi:hypothetical protein
MLAEQGNIKQARQVAARIQDSLVRRTAEARLLYMQKDWQRLASLNPQSDEERMWQLVGLAKQKLRTSGQALVRLIDQQSDLPLEAAQYRVLTAYYGLIGDEAKQSDMARKLVTAIDTELDRLMTIARKAVANKDLDQAERMLEGIHALHPKRNDKLRSLIRKVDALRKESQEQA